MSLRDRILKAAKSNLNTLLEAAADVTDPRRRLADVSDHELEAELERRRAERAERSRVDDAKARVEGVVADRPTRERTAKERADRVHAETKASEPRRHEPPPPRPSARASTGPRPSSGPRPRTSTWGSRPDKKLEKYYQILELQHGATFQEVKSSYRRLMRKYHPDFHRSSPEKHRAAVEVSQALTEAYNHLERELSGK